MKNLVGICSQHSAQQGLHAHVHGLLSRRDNGGWLPSGIFGGRDTITVPVEDFVSGQEGTTRSVEGFVSDQEGITTPV